MFVSETIRQLSGEFQTIPAERKTTLQNLAHFIQSRICQKQPAKLVFICTHNSRRSHIAQVWAQTAAAFYNVPNVQCCSGGTEATAFNPRAVEALRRIGFKIQTVTDGDNPHYTVRYSDTHPPFEVFSKKYDAPENPTHDFAAIMTCSQADEACPHVVGASTRISLPFDDPKDFDGTSLESDKYDERCLEIGREILYAFSKVYRQ
jgi:protein-tyrosine-phosphatase